jgi:hypothetical protein
MTPSLFVLSTSSSFLTAQSLGEFDHPPAKMAEMSPKGSSLAGSRRNIQKKYGLTAVN